MIAQPIRLNHAYQISCPLFDDDQSETFLTHPRLILTEPPCALETLDNATSTPPSIVLCLFFCFSGPTSISSGSTSIFSGSTSTCFDCFLDSKMA